MNLYTLTARNKNNDLVYITGLHNSNTYADICIEMNKGKLDEESIDILKSELHFIDCNNENFIYTSLLIYPNDVDGKTYGSITFNIETLSIS